LQQLIFRLRIRAVNRSCVHMITVRPEPDECEEHPLL
jgi:hypothetical protein